MLIKKKKGLFISKSKLVFSVRKQTNYYYINIKIWIYIFIEKKKQNTPLKPWELINKNRYYFYNYENVLLGRKPWMPKTPWLDFNLSNHSRPRNYTYDPRYLI